MKMSCKCSPSEDIRDYDEFVSSSDLEKCSITSLSQQWLLCSEWVPSEWESKQLMKISQVIHTSPVQDKSWNKSIIDMFLTKIPVHNIVSSSEKVVWSESGEKSAQIKQRLQIKNSSKQICWCI